MSGNTSLPQSKITFVTIVALAVWLVLGTVAFADIRIVQGDGDDQQTFMFQGPRVSLSMPEGEHYIAFCETGTFALVSKDDSAYWHGTPQQFRDEMDDILVLLASVDEDFFEDREPIFLADLFRGSQTPAVNVRTSRVGTETIAGYEAHQYLVEYEQQGVWHEYENLWVSPGLLKAVNAETGGPCMNTVVLDVLRSNLALLIFDMIDEFGVMWSIITSPAYSALLEEGFVVRDHSVVEMYGMAIETQSEVQSVSHEPLNESLFIIPPDAERITLLEAMMI